MEKSNIKVIIIIVSTVLLCGAIAGTAAIISSCNRKNTVNSTENSSVVTTENNNTSENSSTKDHVKETTTANKTEENSEMDTEASQASTEDEETTEATDETTKAPQPTTVVPTEAPTKAPQPTTVAPTEAPTTVSPTEPPTQEPTTASVIHGENGRILDTIYFHYTEESSYGIWKVPETREEFIEVVKGGDINDSCIGMGGGLAKVTKAQKDFFGIGFVLGETTLDEIRAFYGEPYAIEYYSSNTVLFYEYKVEGLIMYFVFQNADSSWKSVHIRLEEEVGIEESENLRRE